jgi:hypothetical protein
VHAWLAMTLARRSRPAIDEPELLAQLDASYRSVASGQDRCEPAYRRLWLAEAAPDGGWFDQAAAQIAATVRPALPGGLPGWGAIVEWQLALAAVRAPEPQIDGLAAEVAWRAGQAAELERKVAWLERQAADTQAALDRIAGGRLMRLIRRRGPS